MDRTLTDLHKGTSARGKRRRFRLTGLLVAAMILLALAANTSG